MKIYLTTIIGVLYFMGVMAQEPDPYALIDSLKSRIYSIQDYAADIEIEVDVDFINMPIKHAKIFYKQPDKIKFKSDEFIMLPKKGFDNQLRKLLNEPYTAIYSGSEKINGQDNYVIKIIPMGKKPDIILATWWINADNFLISRSESNTRDEGTFTIDFNYEDSDLLLPASMVVSFKIEKLSIPLKFIGKTAGMEIDKTKMGEEQEGKVYIRFSNYIINQSLDDSVFVEESGN
ncbi:MAG: hypothetical protein KQI35_07150 [Bacteroidetes bacterium]|nr:hypothetical protein [Bacteroidota bacterium]